MVEVNELAAFPSTHLDAVAAGLPLHIREHAHPKPLPTQTKDDDVRGNDVELFDLKADPSETKNLAAVKGANANLVMAMSAKLERVIKDEIGTDDGREMPDVNGKDINWTLQKNLID